MAGLINYYKNESFTKIIDTSWSLSCIRVDLEDYNRYYTEMDNLSKRLDEPGLYVLVNNKNQRLYVGESSSVNKRIRQHVKSDEKEFDEILILLSDSIERGFTTDLRRDVEAALIEEMNQYGFDLDNKKAESQSKDNWFNNQMANSIMKVLRDLIIMANSNIILGKITSYVEKNQNITEDITIDQTKSKNKLNFEQLDRLATLTRKVKPEEYKHDESKEIYKYLERHGQKYIANGYKKNGRKYDIFNEEEIKKCLLNYLYKGLSNQKVDSLLTQGLRFKGWITAVSLSYYSIPPQKGILGSLGEKKAIQLIDDLVK